jgi:hypothetical protein
MPTRMNPAKRSVHCVHSAYTLETQLFTAGSFAIYTMRLYCYDSYTTDPDVMDQLGFCSHSYTAQPLGIRFYIREDRLSLALLADCELVPRPKLDLIA